MIWSLSSPIRRTLALGILALLCLSVWSLVIGPLIDLSRDRRGDIAALTEQLGRLDAVVARKPELERQTASLQAQLAAAAPALFVDGFMITGPANETARERPPVLNLDLNVAGYMRASKS